MAYFIVETGHGLTRRLIEATDEEGALSRFLIMLTRAGGFVTERVNFTPAEGEITVRPSTESDMAAFGLLPSGLIHKDQISFDIN